MSEAPFGPQSTSSADVDPLGHLADEFAERIRGGENPSVSEYAERFPAMAAEIRELFPALAAMERLKSDGQGVPGGNDGAEDRPVLKRLGDFVILREVGRGGMGVVYEAEQQSLGRHVALKVLLGSALITARTVMRFRREARSAAQLHHSNIVPVFGVGEADGLHYYVMQFINGRGLDAVIEELRHLGRNVPPVVLPRTGAHGSPRLARTVPASVVACALLTGRFERPAGTVADPEAAGRTETVEQPARLATARTNGVDPPADELTFALEPRGASGDLVATPGWPGLSDLSGVSSAARPYWNEVARLGAQAARALGYAHAQGILHRDIKPSNLLLDLQGTIWVTDFGLAKATSDADLTHPGDVVGTLRYMAPERFDGHSDSRSDIYALGLTLYELLTLRPAFDAVDRNRLIQQVTEGDPPRPRTLRPDIPRDLETICLKCIARHPGRRYASADALAEDLELWLDGRPIGARRVSVIERGLLWARRKPALAGTLAFASATLVGGLISVGWYNVQLQHALADSRVQQDRAEGSAYIARVQLVRRSIEVHDATSALGELEALGPESRRGFEWHYLRRLCNYERVARWETGVPVQSLAYSPDGKRIATGHGYADHRGFEARPGEVQVRDADTGAPALKFTAHQAPVFDLGYHPSGRWLATAGGDHLVKVWDAASGALVRTLGPFRLEAHGVVYSPDGRRLAVAVGDGYPPSGYGPDHETPGEVAVYDTETWRLVWRRDEPLGAVMSVAYSPDGARLAWGGFLPLKFSEPETGQVLGAYTANQGGRPRSYSRDGRWLSTSGIGMGMIWDSQSSRVFYTIGTWHRQNRHGWCGTSAFQPNDTSHLALTFGYLPVGHPGHSRQDMIARESAVLIVDAARNQPLYSLMSHEAAVFATKYRPTDGKRLVTAGCDGAITVWLPFDAKPPAVATTHPSPLRALAVHPDGIHVAAGGEDGLVRVDPPAAGAPRSERAGHKLPLLALTYSPDGRELASAGMDQIIMIGPPDGSSAPRVLTGHSGPVNALTYDPTGVRLASASTDGTVRTWDALTGHPLRTMEGHSGTVLAVAYSPDGGRLASLGGDGILRLWDPEAGVLLRSWRAHPGVGFCLTFVGTDGRLLATGGEEGKVRLWRTEDGQPLHVLGGHTREVLGVASGGQGPTRLVSVGSDQTVHLWNPETGQEVIALAGHTGEVLAAGFSRDGLSLYTAGTDRTVRHWDAHATPFVVRERGPIEPGKINGNPDR